jgi:hypothetical protein
MAHALTTLPMQRLERQVVTASDITTLRFPASGTIQDMPNLPSNARHIAITIIGKERGDNSTEAYCLVRFNDDTGSLYNMTRYDIASGDSKAGFSEYGIVGFSQGGPNVIGNASATANAFQASTWLFPHGLIDTGFDKTFLSMGGNPDDAFDADSRLRFGHGRFDDDGSHGAITSVSFLMQGGDDLWLEGSVGTLAVVDEDYNSSSVTLGSDGTITHSSLGASPENIAIIGTVKGSRSDYSIDGYEIQHNADTTAANYGYNMIDGYGGSIANYTASGNEHVGAMCNTSAEAADHAGCHLDQLYQTGNTSGRGVFWAVSGKVDASNVGTYDGVVRIGGGNWENTAAVTSILSNGSASTNLKAGSTEDVYISPPAEYLLDSQTVSGVAFIDFDLSDYDIPDCSTDLKVLIYGAGDRAGWSSGITVAFAAEGGSVDTTAANYDSQRITYATNYGVVGGVSAGDNNIGRQPGTYSAVTSTERGGTVLTLFEWANTGMHKAYIAFGGAMHSDTSGNTHTNDLGLRVYMGRWENTAAVGIIRIYMGDGDGTDLRDGTVVELYSTYGTDTAKIGNTKPTNIAKVNNTATPHSGTEQRNTRINGVLI